MLSRLLQDELREVANKEVNDWFGEQIKEKSKGRNHDLTVAEYKVAQETEHLEQIQEQVSDADIKLFASQIAYKELERKFNDIMAGTIATHRTDVTILWMSDDVKEWDETIHDTRHTLYPVCGDSIDHVIGILNAKDYFRLKEKSKDMVIDSAISAPYFVMETTKADVLFKNMKQSKQSMAIVLDEYGGVVGIVTLFDLLEEIVGDLNDIEPISSEEETVIIRISDNKWEVKGNIRLSDIEDAIGVTFTAEDCDTFTGFVFQKFGMVPKDGDTKIELEIENMHIIIDKIKEHQVEHAIIEILE